MKEYTISYREEDRTMREIQDMHTLEYLVYTGITNGTIYWFNVVDENDVPVEEKPLTKSEIRTGYYGGTAFLAELRREMYR